MSRFAALDESWETYECKPPSASTPFHISVPESAKGQLVEEGLAAAADVVEAILAVAYRKVPTFACSDRDLRDNLTNAVRLLGHDHGLKLPPSAPDVDPIPINNYFVDAGDAIGLFYSGGIDSTFTLMWLKAAFPGRPIVAISLCHTPDARPDPVQVAYYRNRRDVLAREGINLVYVATDVMSFNARLADLWGPLAHGGALAAVGHLLSKNVASLFLSASHDYSEILPWGSHPLLDPLYSSSRLRIVHFGSERTRFEKTTALARSAYALSGLAVCGRGVQAGAKVNCSRCPKCMRTMAAIDLCGARDQATDFDWSDWTPEKFGLLKNGHEVPFAREILAAAEAWNRPDYAQAARRVIRTSWLHERLYGLEMQLRLTFPAVQRAKSHLKPIRDRVYALIGTGTDAQNRTGRRRGSSPGIGVRD
jgi:hypothetical protein